VVLRSLTLRFSAGGATSLAFTGNYVYTLDPSLLGTTVGALFTTAVATGGSPGTYGGHGGCGCDLTDRGPSRAGLDLWLLPLALLGL
jgi:hypothetical protein